MSTFWSGFIIAITAAMIGFCLWLLLSNARGVPGEVKDHVWDDDLREYNNPLPRWWFNLFLLTIIAAVAYLVFYPGLGNLTGRLGWTSTREMQADLDHLGAHRAAIFASLAGKDIPALAHDPAALALGRSVFMANCAGCHGADAKGAIGFPNLTDSDWLFGGDPATLTETVTHGRQSQMPAFNGLLSAEALQALLDFVPYWSDAELDAGKRARGMKQFATTCAACHGADGHGNPVLGAPNLTDTVWLFGGSRSHVRETILWGRKSAMPAHENLLTPDEIRVVAGYVLGQSAAPAESAAR